MLRSPADRSKKRALKSFTGLLGSALRIRYPEGDLTVDGSAASAWPSDVVGAEAAAQTRPREGEVSPGESRKSEDDGGLGEEVRSDGAKRFLLVVGLVTGMVLAGPRRQKVSEMQEVPEQRRRISEAKRLSAMKGG